MSERRIHCARVRLAQGWREGVCLELDAGGIITGISQEPPSVATETLPGIVVPGMANLHSHGFQHLMAGMTGVDAGGRDDFWSWRRAMYGIAARIDPQHYEDCLAWVYLQMLRAGFTCCAEFHYLHHQPDGRPYAQVSEMSARVLAAADRVGMPVTLLPVLYERSGFSSDTVEDHQRRFRNDVDGYQSLLAECAGLVGSAQNCRLGVAPHSLRAVSPQALRDLLDQRPAGERVHLHIAEQTAEVSDCINHTGARPVEWLMDHAPVDDSWCLVHATHMTRRELQQAAASRAVAGVCPITEADLGDGFFETEGWFEAGGRLGIGSDSNVRITVAGELTQLEYNERLRKGRRNVLAREALRCGEFIYTHAAESGAHAISQPAGTLAPGFRADLVELDPEHPLLAGRENEAVLDSWIFSGGPDMVRSVWVGGQRLIDRHHHAAETQVQKGFETSQQWMLEA